MTTTSDLLNASIAAPGILLSILGSGTFNYTASNGAVEMSVTCLPGTSGSVTINGAVVSVSGGATLTTLNFYVAKGQTITVAYNSSNVLLSAKGIYQ